MEISQVLALFGAMIVLALVPGPGVFAVIARSMGNGFNHGVVTATGIVCGDFVYIFLAISGLSALSQVMGDLFLILKYLGAAYLIWLAISLWRANPNVEKVEGIKESSLISSFMAGLLTTLGNPKAIFFYVGFFPAFLDLNTITLLNVFTILLVTTLSVGGVMFGYVLMASRAKKTLSSPKAKLVFNRTASGVMAGSGLLLATKA